MNEENVIICFGSIYWATGLYNLVLLVFPSLRKNARVGSTRQGFRPMTNFDAAFRGSLALSFGYIWIAKANGWPHPEWGAYAMGVVIAVVIVGGVLGLLVDSRTRKCIDIPADSNGQSEEPWQAT